MLYGIGVQWWLVNLEAKSRVTCTPQKRLVYAARYGPLVFSTRVSR